MIKKNVYSHSCAKDQLCPVVTFIKELIGCLDSYIIIDWETLRDFHTNKGKLRIPKKMKSLQFTHCQQRIQQLIFQQAHVKNPWMWLPVYLHIRLFTHIKNLSYSANCCAIICIVYSLMMFHIFKLGCTVANITEAFISILGLRFNCDFRSTRVLFFIDLLLRGDCCIWPLCAEN